MALSSPVSPPTISWKDYNLLARCYLDFQHTGISVEHRIRLMYEDVLMQQGLMEETVKQRANSKGKIIRTFTRKLVEYDEKDFPDWEEKTKDVIRQAKEVEKYLIENNRAYAMAKLIARSARQDEKQMLKQCKELFESTELWNWCLRVRGLGEVAAMTFISYINPEKITKAESAWRYFGLTPNSKLIPGQKASFNLELKGRMYVIKNNIIMQNDPYYAELYRAKKDYYYQIDEILEKKDTIRGWKAWVDAMAKMAMIKIVVSHAVEIILKSNNKPFLSEHRNNRYLPPKPDDASEVERLVDLWKADMPEKVRRRNDRYRESKGGD